MYQYKVANLNSNEFENQLNEYGAKGYKLFQILGENAQTNTLVCLFETFQTDMKQEKNPMECN